MPKKKIETSAYPMMSPEKEVHIRELHMEGYEPKEMATEMKSNVEMVRLWHKMLGLTPNKGSLQEQFGFDPKAKTPASVRYDTPEQKKRGPEIIDNTMPARPAVIFSVSSLL